MHDETLGIVAGRSVDAATGAIAEPIVLSTTFERDPSGEFPRGYSYRRDANPNVRSFELCLRDLEGGADAVAFSTGMAASYAVIRMLSPGDRVVVSRDFYYGFRELLSGELARMHVQAEFVNPNDGAALREALAVPGTKLLWVETPSNPHLEIYDIERCATAAREANVRFVCESSMASPILQKPLELGADVVVHSVTKYLAGHGDVMGGAVVLARSDEFAEALREFARVAGPVLAPFDAWLARRGIETLAVRVRAQSASALRVARALSEHAAVERVYYPGLPADPGHEVARRQMHGGFGAVLSFEVRGGVEAAFAVANRLRLVTRATSFGSTHSCIEHRASIEGEHTRAAPSLLRLAIGLEHPDDVISDLRRALEGS